MRRPKCALSRSRSFKPIDEGDDLHVDTNYTGERRDRIISYEMLRNKTPTNMETSFFSPDFFAIHSKCNNNSVKADSELRDMPREVVSSAIACTMSTQKAPLVKVKAQIDFSPKDTMHDWSTDMAADE